MKPQPQIPLIWHMLTHRHIISLTHVLNVFALVQLVKNTCVDRAELHQYNDLGLQTIAGYPRVICWDHSPWSLLFIASIFQKVSIRNPVTRQGMRGNLVNEVAQQPAAGKKAQIGRESTCGDQHLRVCPRAVQGYEGSLIASLSLRKGNPA